VCAMPYMFQPFLRFYSPLLPGSMRAASARQYKPVSTLLEILRLAVDMGTTYIVCVSTLLEILQRILQELVELLEELVSTLLEILPLMLGGFPGF